MYLWKTFIFTSFHPILLRCSLQANKTKELLKDVKLGTKRADIRDAFAELREKRDADVAQIVSEVIYNNISFFLCHT